MADKKKRKYTKKSPYWNQFGQPSERQQITQASENFQPELVGEPYYVSSATSNSKVKISQASGYSRSSSRSDRHRVNASAVGDTHDPFSAIRGGMLPYNHGSDGVDVSDTVILCQKAYANVAIFRNAIDIMSEFANAEIYLTGGSKKSRDFFTAWFDKINLKNLKDQYFREYYRSGNIFLHCIDGSFTEADFVKLLAELSSRQSASTNKIPLRYVLLNPYDIVSKPSTSFNAADGVYQKMLSQYEIARLRNPQNDVDRDIFNSLPADVREKITKRQTSQDGVYVELDPDKLSFSFYKKQDYEPFAIPFGYAVLRDINAKLELKKMDQAITRTVENVILLITMGAEPDKGGVNHNNLKVVQELFANESVGRVLVSDYTTSAEFIIPDLKKVLGPEKYTTLNEDIKQGLQNIIMGEEKYSSTQVKAEIFIDRLKEARSSFLTDFLQKEIKKVADALGFRNCPEANFKDIDMRDETQLMRVTTRLMELGILTPEQGMEMFNNGRFPNSEELETGHEEFVKKRKKGLFNPIVGGVPVISPPAPKGEKNTTPRVPGRPEGTTGIPVSASRVSRQDLMITMSKIDDLRDVIQEALQEKFAIKKLNKQQDEVAERLCESVVCSTSQENWEEVALSCVNDKEKIAALHISEDVLSVIEEHDLSDFSAAILFHATPNEL